jgi:hypothetical protein
MPLASPSTAEHVMTAVESVVVNGGTTTAVLTAEFLETTPARATAALELAVELGLLVPNGNNGYGAASPLCRFTAVPDQKAAVLRIVIESYRPFTVFRERLVATTDITLAARQTKTVCGLTAHHDEVRDTLISLGTYARAIVTEGGGNYQLEGAPLTNNLQVVALGCTDVVTAEARIRSQIGPVAEVVLEQHRQTVIIPLADALLRARNRDGPGAVQAAGNAVEAHIDAMAMRMTVQLGTATGIISKLNKFVAPTRRLPNKLIQVGTYLGAIRNAADHGTDPDINNAAWAVRDATALEYVFVACSFIAATVGIERSDPPEI